MCQIALIFTNGTRYGDMTDAISLNRCQVLHKFLHTNNNMLKIDELGRDKLLNGSSTFKNWT